MKAVLWNPKSSIPIMAHANGVLVAPANTATKPIPASRDRGRGKNQISAFPKAAPI